MEEEKRKHSRHFKSSYTPRKKKEAAAFALVFLFHYSFVISIICTCSDLLYMVVKEFRSGANFKSTNIHIGE